MADADDGPAIGDREILTTFAETDESPLYAREVADELPVDAAALEPELDDLVERGLLDRDDEFAPGTVYRLGPAADEDELAADEGTVTDTEAQATAAGSQATARDQESVESPPPAPDEVPSNPPYELPTDAIERFDPPGTADQADDRREALRHAYGYLRERGRADREAFVADVFPEYPGGYESPDDGWWSDLVRPGLAQLPGAESTDDDRLTWQFVGTE